MNKKNDDKSGWFLLGFLGIPLMLAGILFSVGLWLVSLSVVFWASVIATIASPFFWNSNRSLAVSMLTGGLTGLGLFFAVASNMPCC